MQSTEKHFFINTKNLQGSKFFRTFKYFLAQHSLKQLIFSLLLFCSLFSFAQEENNASFYVDPSTTIVGINFISFDSIREKDKLINQSALYVVNNTVLYTTEDLVVISIESKPEHKSNLKRDITKVVNNRSKSFKSNIIDKVFQTPFKNSIPFDKKHITVVAVSSVIMSTHFFKRDIIKPILPKNYFELIFDINLSLKENLVTTFCNYILFQIRVKYCNRPPPSIC